MHIFIQCYSQCSSLASQLCLCSPVQRLFFYPLQSINLHIFCRAELEVWASIINLFLLGSLKKTKQNKILIFSPHPYFQRYLASLCRNCSINQVGSQLSPLLGQDFIVSGLLSHFTCCQYFVAVASSHFPCLCGLISSYGDSFTVVLVDGEGEKKILVFSLLSLSGNLSLSFLQV